MQLESFHPQNELERAIADAKAGGRPINDLLRDVFSSTLYISSRSEVQQDGTGFQPLLLGAKNQPLVAAFSSISRPEIHAQMAAYVLQMPGREFLRRLPPGYGVILNPGFDAQLIITPDAAASLRETLAPR